MVELGFKTSYVAASGRVYLVPFVLTDACLLNLAELSDEQLFELYEFLGVIEES